MICTKLGVGIFEASLKIRGCLKRYSLYVNGWYIWLLEKNIELVDRLGEKYTRESRVNWEDESKGISKYTREFVESRKRDKKGGKKYTY